MVNRPDIRQLRSDDAEALCAFYNRLSDESRRTFRPLGVKTDTAACQAVCQANVAGEKYDLVAVEGPAIIGWTLVWDLGKLEPMFGLAVADAWHGRGLGTELTTRVLHECDRRRLPRLVLTVVKDNAPAQHIYQRHGFITYGQFHHDDDHLDYFRMERLLPSATNAVHGTTRPRQAHSLSFPNRCPRVICLPL